jgi:hypothetical protein
MITSWCMWCQDHPSKWKGLKLDGVDPQSLWTIASQKSYVDQIIAWQLKQPKQKGIVSTLLIDFIKPSHYIFPQLHFEIGTANNIIDNFHSFIEKEIEVLSNDKKAARSSVIIADVSL